MQDPLPKLFLFYRWMVEIRSRHSVRSTSCNGRICAVLIGFGSKPGFTWDLHTCVYEPCYIRVASTDTSYAIHCSLRFSTHKCKLFRLTLRVALLRLHHPPLSHVVSLRLS